MKLVSILSVMPVETPPQEHYSVDYLNRLVLAENSESAFEMVKEQIGVKDAAMVYARERDIEAGEVVSSDTKLRDRVPLAQHFHWHNVQDRYQLISGSLNALDRFFEREFAQRYPHLA